MSNLEETIRERAPPGHRLAALARSDTVAETEGSGLEGTPWSPSPQSRPETIFLVARSRLETDRAYAVLIARGGFPMLALKFAVIAAGTVWLIAAFSPDFGGDLVLAIATCLS